MQQDDVLIINTYTPNGKRSKYMKGKLTELKGKFDSSTSTVGDFITPSQ